MPTELRRVDEMPDKRNANGKLLPERNEMPDPSRWDPDPVQAARSFSFSLL